MTSTVFPFSIIRLLTASLAVAGAYLLAMSVQVHWLTGFDRWVGISAFFLPHGVRVVSAMVLRGHSIPGLCLGSLIGSFLIFEQFSSVSLVLTLCSAVFPFASLVLLERLLGPDEQLSRLSPLRFILIVLLSGLANSLTTNLVFVAFDVYATFSWRYVAVMWTGDVLGAAFTIALIWGVVRFVKRFVLSRDQDKSLTPRVWLESIGLLAGGYIVLHHLSWGLFTMPSEVMPWLFLPAALRILAALAYRSLAVPGLFLGTLAVDSGLGGPWFTLGLAVVSCYSSLCALWCLEWMRGQTLNYSSLTIRDALEVTVLAVAMQSVGLWILGVLAMPFPEMSAGMMAMMSFVSHLLGAILLVLLVLWSRAKLGGFRA